MTSDSTRLVSAWGSPGFGKTSVAIAVSFLSIYFLSLRGLKSKIDLTSKFFSVFRQAGTLDTDKLQDLSADDELCFIFDRLPDYCVVILDNVDDLLEWGLPNVKEEVFFINFHIIFKSYMVKLIIIVHIKFVEILDF